MDGEGTHQDYKLAFDPADSAARLELVKNIVAFANAGGGQIVFGRREAGATRGGRHVRIR